jgi:hypothetical protein
MTQMQNAQTVALQLEKVRTKIPILFERDDMLFTMIEKREVDEVSSRNMRLPLEIRPGGKAGAFSLDGGDMGRGSGTTYDVAQVTPTAFLLAVELTKLVEEATNMSEKAIENAAKRELANGMKTFRLFMDQITNTSGNCVLGTITVVTGTVLSLAKPPGATLFYYNETVQVYDSTLTTNRGTANVTLVDPLGVNNAGVPAITVDAVPAGTVATDVLVYNGVSGANPVGLFGVPYHQNKATTGTWLGLNRATYPVELSTPYVSGNSSALIPSVIRQMINRVRMSLGSAAFGKPIGYCHYAQEHAWEQLGVTISQIIKEGGNSRANDLDLLFTGAKTMAGIPIKPSIHARQDRIDFLDLNHWGRAEIKEIDLHDVGGQTVFPIYGASGGLAAAQIFYFTTSVQVWTDNPRAGAYTDSLAIPSGY